MATTINIHWNDDDMVEAAREAAYRQHARAVAATPESDPQQIQLDRIEAKLDEILKLLR